MIVSLTAAIFGGLLLNGCAPSAKIALNFVPKQTTSYESTSHMIKDVEFDQPSLKKNKKDQSSTIIAVKFDQTIVDVQADGTATVDVVIRAVLCKMINKNEVRYDFDSASEKSKADSLNNLVGQSYRIAISPCGKVKVLDAAKARAVVVNGDGQRTAQKILDDETIIERHQLPLPEPGKNMIAAGKNWTQVLPSPSGLLVPKTFEKTYTVSKLDKDKAIVTMSAKESLTKKAEGQKNAGSGMGPFAKMFDNQDQFTGKLVLNLSGGTADEYEETLVSSYTAQDNPKSSAGDAAPDTLVMRLTYGVSLRKIK
jgi:hypothetical protein